MSLTGCTPDGKPLAFSRPPAPDLAPWVHSLAVADVLATEGRAEACAFFSENAAIRVFLKGRWTLHTADGERRYDTRDGSSILYFGPQTKIMPLRVEGPFRFIQLQFRPGTEGKDPDLLPTHSLDRVFAFDDVIPTKDRGTYFSEDDSRERWIEIFEALARRVLFGLVDEPPPPLVLDFERRMLTDQKLDLEAFAKSHGISRRTFERAIAAAYGISPKAALRRARVLDMAAALLGVAMPEEEAKFRLRYFDQAHMTREIQAYFGMPPGKLQRCDAHLLRIDLEIRQMQRVAAMTALGLEDVPWRDDDMAIDEQRHLRQLQDRDEPSITP